MDDIIAHQISRLSDTEPGDYILFLHDMPAAGAGSTIIAIASFSIKEEIVYARTSLGEDIVFSARTGFLIVPRRLTRPLTVKQLVDIQQETRRMWQDAMKEIKEDPECQQEEEPPEGLMIPATGQYL